VHQTGLLKIQGVEMWKIFSQKIVKNAVEHFSTNLILFLSKKISTYGKKNVKKPENCTGLLTKRILNMYFKLLI
jgi:hypothetical protein